MNTPPLAHPPQPAPGRDSSRAGAASTGFFGRVLGRLALAAVLALALAALIAVLLHNHLDAWHWPPVSVVIDGDEIFHGVDLKALPPAQMAGLVGGLTLALLIVVVVLPLTLLAVVGLLLFVLLFALGLPLLMVGAVFMLLLSPLLLLGLLMWWLLRPSRRTPSATMAA